MQHSFKLWAVNAMSAMSNFVGPIVIVFSFLEDTILTRISYTMAKGQKQLANAQFWTAIKGSVLMGCAAALIVSIVGATKTGFGAILNPGYQHRLDIQKASGLMLMCD